MITQLQNVLEQGRLGAGGQASSYHRGPVGGDDGNGGDRMGPSSTKTVEFTGLVDGSSWG